MIIISIQSTFFNTLFYLALTNYQQKIRNILCDQINENNYKNEVSFVSVEKQPHNNEKIIIIKGSIKIELDSDTPYQSIEPLLKSLL